MDRPRSAVQVSAAEPVDPAERSAMSRITQDYPLSEKRPDRLRTPTGLSWKDIDLQSVLDGTVRMSDLRITPEALELQAQIADSADRHQLAENLRRAAELVTVPEAKILEVYRALRPGRSNRKALESLAAELESEYRARRCARFVREAAQAYHS